MKRIKTPTNINQLWQPLPEFTQEVIRGGGGDTITDFHYSTDIIVVRK